MQRQACSVFERLSKATFLSMLGYSPYQRQGGYTNDTFYVYKGKVYSTPVNEEFSPNATRAYFEKLNSQNIPWTITSFNSKNREVCVEIQSKSGLRELSITLPQILPKEVS